MTMRFCLALLCLTLSTAAFADETEYSIVFTDPVYATQLAEQSAARFCDINGDGFPAGVADYIVFFNAYQGTTDDPYFLAWADLDRNRVVNSTDYGILLRLCPLGGGE